MVKKDTIGNLRADSLLDEPALIREEIRVVSQKLDLVLSEINERYVVQKKQLIGAKLLTVNQLAKILYVAPGTLYNKVSLGTIPYVKVGGSIRFTEDHVSQILSKERGIRLGHDLNPKHKF